jgi:hypothetical protein
MDRRPTGFSRPVVVGFGTLVVLVYTLATARLAKAHSHFIGDDLVSFFMATHTPLGAYLVMPLDIHLAPLHRLLTWIIRTLWPMNFGVALGVLAAFHLSGVLLLYSTLERLSAGRHNWVLVGLYATHVYLLDLFLWWTAGLHRLPCTALSIAAVYAYLRFRDGARWRWAVVIFASELAAFGFFIKAMLIPVFLCGLEWCLRKGTSGADRKKNGAVLAGATVIGAMCPLIWFATATGPARALALDLRFQLDCQRASWPVLLESTLGFVRGGGFRAAITAAVWMTSVAVTARADRSRLGAWAWLAGTVSASILVTCLPFSRFVFFGGTAVDRVHRYYFELMLPVTLFTALAMRGFSFDGVTRILRSPKAAEAIFGGLLVLSGVHSYANARELLSTPPYAAFEKQKRFLDRLRHDLGELEARGVRDPVFIDRSLPPYVLGWIGPFRRQSTLFAAMGIQATFGPPYPHIAYLISDNGAVLQVGH